MIGGVVVAGSPPRPVQATASARLFEQPGRFNMLLAFAAFAFILFGVKLLIIQKFGNNTPYWDQWDAEAALLYEPYLRGDLPWKNLIAGHNEHRILTTRLLDLLLLQLNGLWSPMLEMVVNAGLHILALGVTVGLLAKATGKAVIPPLLLFATVLFSIPYALENTLAGFQAQFYFVLLFSVLSIWLLVTHAAFERGWWGGVAIALIAYFSFASGIFAPAAAAVTLLLRVALVSRDRREVLAAVLLTGLFLLGVWATPVIPGHAELKAVNAQQLVHALTHVLAWPTAGGSVSPQWPSPRECLLTVLRNLPWLMLALRVLRERPSRSDPLWFLIALGVWLTGQAVSVSYGRAGDVLSSRYLDLHAIGLLVNFGALLACISMAPQRHKTAWAWGAFAWTAWVLVALGNLGVALVPNALEAKRASSAVQEANVQAYLGTHDLAAFRAAPLYHLPYPDAGRLASLLDAPQLRSILPVNLQTPLTVDSLEPAMASGFEAGGAFPGTKSCQCQFWGSYGPQGDRDTGELRMTYRPIEEFNGQRHYKLRIAGYPSKAGNVELIQKGKSRLLKIDKDPGEDWTDLYISVESGPFVIRATDASPASWLAISQPTRVGRFDKGLEELLSAWVWMLAAGAALACLVLFFIASRSAYFSKYSANISLIPDGEKENAKTNGSELRKVDSAGAENDKKSSLVKIICSAVIAGLLTISWKLELQNGIDIGRLMWAEDGVVFLKGAVEHGIASLWIPYAGYFHAYPRIIAWLSTFTDLHRAPTVFFAGWCFALLILAWTCAKKFNDAMLGAGLAAAAMVLMLTQPNDGEIFYSLTNAQWLLAAALALYLFMPSASELRGYEIVLIFLLALTGPFICVLFPLWFIDQWLSKKPKNRKLMVVLLVTFLIQSGCFLISDRSHEASLPISVHDWMQPVTRFFSLAQSQSTRWLAIVFWLSLLGGLIVAWRRTRLHSDTPGRHALLLLAAAAGLLAAGLYAARANPGALGPMGISSRYYFVPYCLVYVAAILLFRFSKPMQLVIVCLIVGINWMAWSGRSEVFFQKFGRTDAQIVKYLRLAENSPGVKIPISPSPDWSFELHQN